MPTPKQYENATARQRAFRERRRLARQAEEARERQAQAEAEQARQAQAERTRELTAEVKATARVMLKGFVLPSIRPDPDEREAWQRMLDYVERWRGW